MYKLYKVHIYIMSIVRKEGLRDRPHYAECTTSRLICEVKQRQAWVVLRWETTGEVQVPITFFNLSFTR